MQDAQEFQSATFEKCKKTQRFQEFKSSEIEELKTSDIKRFEHFKIRKVKN